MKKSKYNFLFRMIAFNIFFSMFFNVIAYKKICAQYMAEENWHQGKVLLDTGDSLIGNIKFNLKEELLLVNSVQGLQTLSSRRVAMFSFFDIKEKRDRQFYTFEYPKVNNYKTPCFFEVIYHGEKISLIGREVLTYTTINTRPQFGGMYGQPMGMPQTIASVKMEMYFLYNSGKVKAFGGSKNDVYTLLPDAQAQMKAYIKQNKPNLERPNDVVKTLVYYNEIKKN